MQEETAKRRVLTQPHYQSQPTHPEISIVLPCLNEEQAIGGCIDTIQGIIDSTGISAEILVVDNASTDRSAEIARVHGARVVYQPVRGYGNAYLKGFAEAHGQYIVMADADNTYDFNEIQSFIEPLRRGYDLVMGNRFSGRMAKGAMTWSHRYIGNPILSGLLNMFFHTGVRDAHCGMRAFTKEAYRKMRLHTGGMEFASEMVINAAKARLKITERPIAYHPRIGESKLHTFRDGWRHLRFMLLYSPTHLFLVPGLLLFLLGCVILGVLLPGPLMLFGHQWDVHTMMLGSVLSLIGAQVVLFGLFARFFSLTEDLDGEDDNLLQWINSHFSLERGLILGGSAFTVGLLADAYVLYEWIAVAHMGHLAEIRLTVLATALIALGTEIMFGSFFLSFLQFRKSIHSAPADSRPQIDRTQPSSPPTDEEMPYFPLYGSPPSEFDPIAPQSFSTMSGSLGWDDRNSYSRPVAQPSGNSGSIVDQDSWQAQRLRLDWLLVLINIGILTLGVVIGAVVAAHQGIDVGWDARDYHYYNGFATLTGVWIHNFGVSIDQSYYMPTLDVAYYLLIKNLSPRSAVAIMGGFAGINFWLAFQLAERLISVRRRSVKWVLSLSCAALGLYAPTNGSEFGALFGDSIISVLSLGGILLLVIAVSHGRVTRGLSWFYLVMGGLLLGAGMGSKYTAAVYVLAAALALLCIPTMEGLKRAIVFSVGAIAGILLTAGYWMYDMEVNFGSPLFPMFNSVFHSPYANSVPWDSRFFPKTVVEWLFAPFYFVQNSTYQPQEPYVPFQNIGFAVIYVLLFAAALFAVWHRIARERLHNDAARNTGHLQGLLDARVFVITLFVAAFITWEVTFSIYRYLSTLELLAPIVIVLLVTFVVQHEQARVGIVLLIFAAMMLTMRISWFGRESLTQVQLSGGTYFGVNAPLPIASSQHALVVINSSTDAIAFFAAYLPQSDQVVRINSTAEQYFSPVYWTKVRSAINQHPTPIFLMSTNPDPVSQDVQLSSYGLKVMPGSCSAVTTFSAGSVYFCTLARTGSA